MNSINFWSILIFSFHLYSGAAQISEWTAFEFNGSMSQIVKEIDGELYLLVGNGATNEIIPGVDYKVVAYRIQFEIDGTLDFMPVEFITLSSQFDSLYATLSIDYISNTKEWLIIQTYNLSPGNLRFRFLLCDDEFNIESKSYIDILGYLNVPFYMSNFEGHTYLIGAILGPPKSWMVFMDYNHNSKGILPSIKIGQTSPMQSTWITSMFVDPRTLNMLCFYYDGIQELDTNLYQVNTYSRQLIHTGTHGQVISKGPYYYSHGSYRFGTEGYKINLLQKYDTLFQIISSDTLGNKAHDNYPFVFNSMDTLNNTILIGGHLDGPFSHQDIFHSVKKFYLSKYDDQLNQLWYKEYGGDRAYWMTGLKILKDESSMAYGFITDTIDGFRHAYIMHVAKNGDLISSTELDKIDGNGVHLANETGGNIIISNQNNLEIQFNLFDLNGIRIMSKTFISDGNKIDLNFLPQACYYYSIVNKSKLLTSGKIVNLN
jgi:hypothetical protein